MTLKELYEDACKKGIENAELKVKYRDEGGEYYGRDDEIYNIYK